MPDTVLPPVSMINVGKRRAPLSDAPLGGPGSVGAGLHIFEPPEPSITPQAIARTNRVAQKSGMAIQDVEGNEEGMERAMKAVAAMSLAATDHAYAIWAEQNPREALLSTEDTKALTGLKGFWDDVKKVPARLGGEGGYRLGNYAADFFNTLGDAQDAVAAPIHALIGALGAAHGIDGLNPNVYLKENRKRRLLHSTALESEATRIADANRGNNRISEGLLAGTASVPMTVAALVTRSPAIATAMFGGLTGADAYVEAREKGLGTAEAVPYALGVGSLEGATERFAYGKLMDVVSGRVPFFGAALAALGAEMTGEQINTFLSDMLRHVHLPENQGKTIEDFIAERPDAAIDTALAVIGGTGATVAGIKTAQSASKLADRIAQTRQTKRQADFLDRADREARNSELRRLDPEAFRSLMRAQAANAGSPDVFISPEAVREFQQSDAYDPDNDPFDARRWELDDLIANGQDIVMPMEDFLTDVAGTTAYAAIRDRTRLIAGGASVREALEFEEALADLEAETLEEFEQADRQERDAMSLRERLVDRVATQFGASYTAPVARQIAELAVAREEVRAARMGRSLSLQTLGDLDVRQVMPESARAVKAADELDLVFNAMMQGKPARYGKGDTLLRFLKKRGGVLDTGGDLAAMGVHHSFIKKGDPRQASAFGPTGLGEFGLDSALRAAIEAGYFPELDHLRSSEFTDEADVNVLLEAISEELAGNPRYIDWVDDSIRQAADDLGDALRSAGFDPVNMSEDQLREAAEALIEDNPIDTDGQYYEQGSVGSASHWGRMVDAIVRGDKAPVMVGMGETPPVLRQLGFPANPMQMARGKIARARREHPEVPLDVWRNLPQLIAEPRAIFPSQRDDGSMIVAIEAQDANGDPIIVPVIAAEQGGNIVLSVYGKTGGDAFIAREIERAQKAGVPLYVREGLADALVTSEEVPGTAASHAPIASVVSAKPRRKILTRRDPVKTLDQDARGRIVFENTKRTIELFEGRNFSTAVHELGHMWLEDLQADATHAAVVRDSERLDADARASLEKVVADWEAVKAWFADNGHPVGADGVVPVEAHEMWARGTERYVMEGKSPSGALTELFRAFSAFMKRIYKAVDALRAPITPEIREVFERLIATDAEIVEARESQGLSALFEDAAAAGMTEQEFGSYTRMIQRGRDAAESKLLGKVMRAITVRETKLWKERAADIAEEVGAGLDATPLFRAMAIMAGKRAPKMPKVAAGTVRLWESDDGTYRKERGEAEYYVDVPASHAALKGVGDADIMLPEELTGTAQPVPVGDDPIRISRQWIVDRFGADALKLMPKRVPSIYEDGGVHPEDVAQRAGYRTADEMVNALIGAEKSQRDARERGDKRPMRKRMLDDAVKIEMGRRYGDPLNDGSIEREAMDAVRNDEAGELMATELRVLSRGGAAQKVTPWRVAKNWARAKVRGGEVRREASPSAIARYQRAAAKAAREAELALAAGDREGAFEAKHKQMVNSALASEASAAMRDVEAAQARLSKIAKARTRKSIDQDYLERAQALLETVDLKRRSQILLERAGKFEDWAQEQEANGIDIATPAGFEAVLAAKNWTQLSIDEFMTLDDAVKQILHLGRFKQTLRDAKEARDFEEVLAEAEATAEIIGRKPVKSHLERDRKLAGLINLTAIKRNILSFDASLLKMEQIFLWLDNGNRNGVFHRYVFRPIAEAQERERKMLADYQAEIMAHMDVMPKETKQRWADKVSSPFIHRVGPMAGQPVVFERSQVIAMALNWGNEGNRQRLIDGEGWNESMVEGFLFSTLDAHEWVFVQSVWDTIGKLWPDIQRVERNVNGFAPEEVDGITFDTPHGSVRGGYYPAVYDPRGSFVAQDQTAMKDGLLGAKTVRATTRASSTKERAQKVVGRPLLYDLSVISRHLGEVIHDVTHREALVQAHKFLSNPRIRKLTGEVLNPEIEKLFKPWLKQIADSWAMDRAGMGALADFMKAMRANVTVVAMGWRWTTVMTQIAGYANGLEMMRKRDLGGALARFAKNPVGSAQFVLDSSYEMRGRVANIDANISAALSKLDNPLADKRKRAFTAAKRFAFHGIGYMDRVVTIPLWMGAYDAAVKRGDSHDNAVHYADGVVRMSQGASGPKDLAAVQSGQGTYGEAVKFLTFFYTYFSAFYNRQRNLGRDFRRIESVKEMPALLARSWWLLIVPPLLAEFLAGRAPSFDGDDDDEEGLFGWAARSIASQFVGGIPLLRDLGPIVWNKLAGNPAFGYRFSPISGGAESVERFIDEINRMREGKETKRLTRTSIELVGYTTGLTTGQMAATAQFLVDVSEGDAQPEGFWDWYTGLTKGKLPDD